MSPVDTVNVGTMELASVDGWVIPEAVDSRSFGESVGVGKAVLASAPELVPKEVTTPDTPGDTLVFGMSELASTPELVAAEGGLSPSLIEAFGVVPTTGVPVCAEWPHGAVVSVSPGEIVKAGKMELASDPGWVIPDAVVFGSCGESVGVGKVVLSSAPELVTREVTVPDTLGVTLVCGMSEVPSAPGWAEGVLPDSLWVALGVVMETGVTVPPE